MFDDTLLKAISEAGIVPVIVLENPADGVPLAECYLKAGLRVMEVTFRAAGAAEAIRSISQACPDMMVGAGTLITPENVREAKAAGAKFGVSPGCNPRTLAAAQEVGLSFAPGVMTPSDIERGLEAGCKVLKYFPAESAGGVKHLKSLSAPYKHLNLQYIPTGGIDAVKAPEYLKLPNVPAVGGSWVAPNEAIQKGDWTTVESLVRDALSILKA